MYRGADKEILDHCHFGEDLAAFRHVRDSMADDLVRPAAENRFSPISNVAADGSHQAARSPEYRRLASAIWAKKCKSLTFFRVEVDVPDHSIDSIGKRQVVNFENLHGSPPR
jgi:hypothetical protein